MKNMKEVIDMFMNKFLKIQPPTHPPTHPHTHTHTHTPTHTLASTGARPQQKHKLDWCCNTAPPCAACFAKKL